MSATHEDQKNPAAGGEPVAAQRPTAGVTATSAGWCGYCKWDEDEDILCPFNTSSVRLPSPEEEADEDEWGGEVQTSP